MLGGHGALSHISGAAASAAVGGDSFPKQSSAVDRKIAAARQNDGRRIERRRRVAS